MGKYAEEEEALLSVWLRSVQRNAVLALDHAQTEACLLSQDASVDFRASLGGFS